jgi:DivIVA domain-containing protein
MMTRGWRWMSRGRRVREPRRVGGEIRNVGFPISVRGYNRRAVDAYVARANRMIAELEGTRSPQRAVKRALERTEDERRTILDEARGMGWRITAAAGRKAEAITAKARAEAADIVVAASAEADRTQADADKYAAKTRTEAEKILANSRVLAADRLRRAREEIAALREEAEAQSRALRIDTEAIWGDRHELLDDLRDIAARLHKAASHHACAQVAREHSPPDQQTIATTVRQDH